MWASILRIIFPVMLIVTFFSLWAAFALLVINKFYYKDLEGYVIGRICIYEWIALMVAAGFAFLILKKWGNIQVKKENDKQIISLNYKYGILFTAYFLICVAIAIWQFYVFSQNF